MNLVLFRLSGADHKCIRSKCHTWLHQSRVTDRVYVTDQY
ncbi:hypothetical protein SP19_134 [Salmonella phage 19]|nr:hypothetical protein SP19_134 [Salmonella phage 19]